jgi:hypothetical protein
MRRLLLVVMLASLLLGRVAAAQDRFPGAAWDHLPPAQSGWSEALLADVRAWSEQIHSTAFMVVHRGVVVAEWGDTTKRTELASVRKSLLSALIGIAVAERKISLDSTLAQLGIDDNAPALTDAEKQATVRMLLEARSGIYHPALYETPGMAKQRPARGSHEPGTFWYYNNWDAGAGWDSGGHLHRLGRRRPACVRHSRLRSGGGESGRSRPETAGTEIVRRQAAGQPDVEGWPLRSLSDSTGCTPGEPDFPAPMRCDCTMDLLADRPLLLDALPRQPAFRQPEFLRPLD